MFDSNAQLSSHLISQVQGPGKVHELESTVAALTARCAELEARLQMQVRRCCLVNPAEQQHATCKYGERRTYPPSHDLVHPQGSDPAAPQSPGASPQRGFDAQRADSGDGSTHGGDASGQQGASSQFIEPRLDEEIRLLGRCCPLDVLNVSGSGCADGVSAPYVLPDYL